MNFWVHLTKKKPVGFDIIPSKLAKIAASVLYQPLPNTKNTSLSKGIFPDNAKIATVSPLDKGTSNKNDISYFWPVSTLTTLLKIYERVTKKLTDKAMDKYWSLFISAYGQNSSNQHVLIRLLEKWREGLDTDFVVGGVFTDLSKAFDWFPHDLLIAKLVDYLYSYLDNKKQCVSINNEKSSLKYIISVVPQGSIARPTLFNLFFNIFLLFISIAWVHNFADDNSLSNIAKKVDSLKQTLESECKLAIKWFHENKMIVNPDKFQAFVLDNRNSSNTEVILSLNLLLAQSKFKRYHQLKYKRNSRW